MSILSIVNFPGNATKSQIHKIAHKIDYQSVIVRLLSCVGALVAIKGFFK
jgi:hypothetical protein